MRFQNKVISMDIILSSEQVRILGVLLEKEITTPDYYPMTLNSLVNACNQKSCREPVTAIDEGTVTFHLDILRDEKRLVALVAAADSRVPKFKQRITESFFFSSAERALLTELMLRGAQTPGELRNRADRMHKFKDIDEVNATLKELEARPDGPWIVLLPRLAGHKEARYMHLMSGPPAMAQEESGGELVSVSLVSPTERITQLETETAALRKELDELRGQFTIFKSQF